MRCFHEIVTDTTFSREAEILFSGCDPLRRAKLSTVLGLAIGAAGADYDARALPYEVLREMRQVFLLSRLTLRVRRMPRLGDVLTVTTWEDGVRGAHMERGCAMADEGGAVCVCARSHWVLVDPETRRILRPGSFTARTIQAVGLPLDCPDCGKVPAPGAEAPELGERRVAWSDLDGNGHVYSGAYGDIFWDYLPEALQERPFREFSINYHREAVRGEVLRLTGCREGDGFRMAGQGGGGLCFTAACRFREA